MHSIKTATMILCAAALVATAGCKRNDDADTTGTGPAGSDISTTPAPGSPADSGAGTSTPPAPDNSTIPPSDTTTPPADTTTPPADTAPR